MLRDQQQKRPVGIEYQPDLVAAVGRGMNGAEIHVLKTVGCSAVYVHDADISQASLHLLVNNLIQIVIAQRMVVLISCLHKCTLSLLDLLVIVVSSAQYQLA